MSQSQPSGRHGSADGASVPKTAAHFGEADLDLGDPGTDATQPWRSVPPGRGLSKHSSILPMKSDWARDSRAFSFAKAAFALRDAFPGSGLRDSAVTPW